MAETMEMAQLLVRLGIAPGDMGAFEQALDSANGKLEETAETTDQAAGRVKEAGGEFGRFRSPVLEAIFAVQAFTSEVKETIAVLAELTGVKVASEYRHLQNALENVTGSAKEAKEMLEQIEDIKSPYLNQVLLASAPKLMNSGLSAGKTVHDIKSMSNLGAMGNLTSDQMPEFMDTMLRLRNMDHPMIRQLESLNGLPITKLVNAGAGTHFQTANQAYDYLGSTGRGKAYDILMKGADALGADAAAMLLLRDPAMALAKGFEQLEEMMKPTGDLILQWVGDLQPLWGFLAGVVHQITEFNKATGGAGGLLFIVMIVVRSWRLMTDTFKAAIRFTRELTEAIQEYGEGADMAAIRTRHMGGGAAAEKEGAEAGEIAAKSAAGGKGLFKWVREIPAMLKGVKVAEIAPKLLKGALKMGDFAGFAADMALEAIGGNMKDKAGNQTRAGAIVQGVGNGLGWGGLGMLAGPEVGLVTMLIGAIAGGVMGGKDWKKESAERRHTDAVEKNTAALQDVKSSFVGTGGERTNRAMSQVSLEISLARMIA